MTDTNDENDRSMREISHTNPYTGEVAGRLLSRGPTVVADGGERPSERQPAATDSTDRSGTDRQMKNVSHTPPNGTEDANDVFERGREYGREREEGTTDV
jgi:hypothetical protein